MCAQQEVHGRDIPAPTCTSRAGRWRTPRSSHMRPSTQRGSTALIRWHILTRRRVHSSTQYRTQHRAGRTHTSNLVACDVLADFDRLLVIWYTFSRKNASDCDRRSHMIDAVTGQGFWLGDYDEKTEVRLLDPNAIGNRRR